MAKSLNRAEIIGHLGADPKVTTFQGGGKVVNFSVATSESWTDKQSGEQKERTQWINISIQSDGLADIAAKYLKKGSRVYLEGQIETRNWNDNAGTKHWATEVVVRPFRGDMIMLDAAPERPQPSQQDAPQHGPGGRR